MKWVGLGVGWGWGGWFICGQAGRIDGGDVALHTATTAIADGRRRRQQQQHQHRWPQHRHGRWGDERERPSSSSSIDAMVNRWWRRGARGGANATTTTTVGVGAGMGAEAPPAAVCPGCVCAPGSRWPRRLRPPDPPRPSYSWTRPRQIVSCNSHVLNIPYMLNFFTQSSVAKSYCRLFDMKTNNELHTPLSFHHTYGRRNFFRFRDVFWYCLPICPVVFDYRTESAFRREWLFDAKTTVECCETIKRRTCSCCLYIIRTADMTIFFALFVACKCFTTAVWLTNSKLTSICQVWIGFRNRSLLLVINTGVWSFSRFVDDAYIARSKFMKSMLSYFFRWQIHLRMLDLCFVTLESRCDPICIRIKKGSVNRVLSPFGFEGRKIENEIQTSKCFTKCEIRKDI